MSVSHKKPVTKTLPRSCAGVPERPMRNEYNRSSPVKRDGQQQESCFSVGLNSRSIGLVPSGVRIPSPAPQPFFAEGEKALTDTILRSCRNAQLPSSPEDNGNSGFAAVFLCHYYCPSDCNTLFFACLLRGKSIYQKNYSIMDEV